MSAKIDMMNVDLVKDVCSQQNFMLVETGNKLYTLGGYIELQNGTERVPISNSYLRVVDFSTGSGFIDVSKDKITTVYRIPEHVPVIKWGNLFVNNGKLRLFDGLHEYYRVYSEDGTLSTTPRPSIINRIFTYDIAGNSWSGADDGQLSGFTEGQTMSRAATTRDAGGVGWLYGGIVQTWEYYQGENTTGKNEKLSDWKAVVRVEAEKQPEVILGMSDVSAAEQAEMVFIDGVGKAGVLVVIGGIVGENMRSMKSVDIFDIDSKLWYTQATTADNGAAYPQERHETCSVVASAPDKSSHNIYIYGGHIPGSVAYQDVFVLSIPAFHWVNVRTGLERPRYGHKCAKVQEKYMIAYRGRRPINGCDTNAGIQVFDMSTLQWTSKVQMDGKQKYTVPEKVYKVIGGDANGNATFIAPRSNWADPRLAAIFKIENAGPTSSSNKNSSTNTNIIVGAIIGSILGLAVLIALLLFFRKRYRDRKEVGPVRKAPPTEMEGDMPRLRWPAELQGSKIVDGFHGPVLGQPNTDRQ